MRAIAWLLTLLLFSGATLAKACTPADAEAAESAVDHLSTWDAVNQAFSDYGQCDEGSISEGISGAVVSLLANNWDELPDLTKIISKNPKFEGWVLNHINTTVDDNDLDKIIKNSDENCPEGNEVFCKKLNETVLEVFSEY